MAKATRWCARWGHWSLLGSWLPVIGDPLALAAGVLREPLWRFVLIVTIGKGGRYLMLAWITQNLAGLPRVKTAQSNAEPPQAPLPHPEP